MRTPSVTGAVGLQVASARVYVVYEARTGEIRHVHESVTFAGAAQPSAAQAEARALALAARFGHRAAGLRVLPVEAFDDRTPQRVDVRRQRLVAARPGAHPARPAAGTGARTAGGSRAGASRAGGRSGQGGRRRG
jgi:hypothetical protein